MTTPFNPPAPPPLSRRISTHLFLPKKGKRKEGRLRLDAKRHHDPPSPFPRHCNRRRRCCSCVNCCRVLAAQWSRHEAHEVFFPSFFPLCFVFLILTWRVFSSSSTTSSSGSGSQKKRILEIGDTYQLSRRFTEEELRQFGEISQDLNPLHFDDNFARTTRFGRRILHGHLVTSLFSGILGMQYPYPPPYPPPLILHDLFLVPQSPWKGLYLSEPVVQVHRACVPG